MQSIFSVKKAIKEPVMILPFYGEYGWFLTSFIRLVHYLQAPQKIVCCRRGEEIYFPSASGFYYDWKDIFSDDTKCGFRDTWPIGPVENPTRDEVDLQKRLKTLFPDFEQVSFDHPIPLEHIKDYPVPIEVTAPYDIPPLDVVICARYRNTMGTFGDKGIRNYLRWPEIVKLLSQSGYRLGIIGKADTSYQFKEVSVASWNFPDNTAAILQMLKQTRVYIGT